VNQERVKELLEYNEVTGLFIWKVKPCRGIKIGTTAGGIKIEGYCRIKLDGKFYYAHRLAFLYIVGRWPSPEIDHIDGNRSNNSWRNLREATSSINKQNRRVVRKDSESGLIGAMKNKKGFMARIGVNGAKRYIGTFPSASEANAAYITAKRKLHPGGTI